MWGGPVVAVSSKPDLIELCLEARHERPGARTYVLDLSGEVPDDDLPADVQKVVVDPVALITCDDDAIDLATILMQAGAAGAGGGTGGKGGDAFWENISTAPLAALLRAAAPAASPGHARPSAASSPLTTTTTSSRAGSTPWSGYRASRRCWLPSCGRRASWTEKCATALP
jgi:hypothetical protein